MTQTTKRERIGSVVSAPEEIGGEAEPTESRDKKRLVLADPLFPEGLALLREAPGIVVEDLSNASRGELLAALPGAAGLIVRSRTQVDAELLEEADGLEVIGRAGVGVDNIDLALATRRGIAVVNAPGGNTTSTVELAFGLLLAAARRIPEGDRSVREGRWERKRLRGRQLQGKTLGVVGAGRIGSGVIHRARAFGMQVIVHDPYLTKERVADLELEPLELHELLERSDFVTLHVPLTETTRGMIGPAEIGVMKEGAILINAARGGLVDEDALAVALRTGRLGGAALDVYGLEPLPVESPLRDVPNLTFTPHIGAATTEAQREVSREIAIAVREALLDGSFGAALNAPYVGSEGLGAAGPVLELARRLGVVLSVLTESRADRLDVRYAGAVQDALRPLAAATVEGYLRSAIGLRVNMVNALTLAAERGIEIGRVRIGDLADYTNYVELRAFEDDKPTIVGGALLGEAHHPRIVRVGDFHVDTIPTAVLLIIRNRDVPGVIGEVGTALGSAGVNIAEYHLSRKAAGGEALGLVRIDEALPPEVLSELRASPAIEEVRQVVFAP